MLAADSEQLTKEHLEERLIKLTENSVIWNKNINPDEFDDFNKGKRNIAISEHPVQSETFKQSVTFDLEQCVIF